MSKKDRPTCGNYSDARGCCDCRLYQDVNKSIIDPSLVCFRGYNTPSLEQTQQINELLDALEAVLNGPPHWVHERSPFGITGHSKPICQLLAKYGRGEILDSDTEYPSFLWGKKQ